MRGGDNLHPPRGRQFVGAQFLAHAVIENFRSGAGNAAEPFVFHHLQVITQGHSCFHHTVIDFHRRERMHMHFWNGTLDGAEKIAVEKSVEVARQPALDANLGGAAFPRLARAADDFVQRERISVGSSGAAPEAAKTASDETDVREINISIYDVSDGVADGLPAQLIGESNECLLRRSFCARQDQSLLEGQLLAASCGMENLANFCWTGFRCRYATSVHRWRGHFLCILPEEAALRVTSASE